jgi:alpha-galactosidase
VREVADSLVSKGLARAGYNIVWLDGGWQDPEPRTAAGDLRADRTRFPNGLKPVVDYIHSKGLKAGIYTDAGPYIPGRCGLGSGGYYQRDANQFAAWRFDARPPSTRSPTPTCWRSTRTRPVSRPSGSAPPARPRRG